MIISQTPCCMMYLGEIQDWTVVSKWGVQETGYCSSGRVSYQGSVRQSHLMSSSLWKHCCHQTTIGSVERRRSGTTSRSCHLQDWSSAIQGHCQAWTGLPFQSHTPSVLFCLYLSKPIHWKNTNVLLLLSSKYLLTSRPYKNIDKWRLCIEVQEIMWNMMGKINHAGQLSLAILLWVDLHTISSVDGSQPPPGKKRRVMRDSRFYYQYCWHTGLVS